MCQASVLNDLMAYSCEDNVLSLILFQKEKAMMKDMRRVKIAIQ